MEILRLSLLCLYNLLVHYNTTMGYLCVVCTSGYRCS